MIDFTIKAETEDTKNAFLAFCNNYKGNVAEFMNLILKNSGHMADVSLTFDEEAGGLTLHQIAPDRGWVMADIPSTSVSETGESKQEMEVGIVKYANVPVGDKYMTFREAGIWVMLKEEKGVPDTKVGHFKDLNDGVKLFNSKDVLDQIEKTKKESKKEDKVIEKLKKGEMKRRGNN